MYWFVQHFFSRHQVALCYAVVGPEQVEAAQNTPQSRGQKRAAWAGCGRVGRALATAAKWESGRNQKGSLSVNLCRLRLPAIEAETVRASSARTEIRTQDRPKQKKKGSLSDSHCRLWFQGSYPQTVRASKPALRFELRTEARTHANTPTERQLAPRHHPTCQHAFRAVAAPPGRGVFCAEPSSPGTPWCHARRRGRAPARRPCASLSEHSAPPAWGGFF